MGNTILLADKSVTIQKIVQLTFADDNYTIQCVSDGQTAIDTIPQVRPDLILADISLPLKTGYDVCRMLRTDSGLAAFSHVPVILLAGIYETMDEERAKQVEDKVKEVEANDFLSKPFDPQILIAKVRQYMKPQAAAKPTEPENIFADVVPSNENIFSGASASEFQSVEPPPDDGERTMMIPGGIKFPENMFADPLPLEEESEEPKRELNIQSMQPLGEPLFDDDPAAFTSVDSGEGETEQTLQVPAPSFQSIDRYNLSMEDQPPFSPENSEEALPLIMPSDEPFGEVFDEPPAVMETLSSSEDESPFGLPPAPPAPEPEPEPVAVEPVMQLERPEPPFPFQEPVENALQEEAVYEDTWPGVHIEARSEAHVEELFEAEPAAVSGAIEEAEELEPDLSENGLEPEEVEPAPQPATEITAPVAAAPAVTEITDEIVDKIAERVVAKLSERVVSEIVWQVVPDLAEKMIRRELEKLHAGEE